VRAAVRLLVVVLALLAAGVGWAQESKGWLGADLRDVTKEEAEKLGWEAPRGTKILVPRQGGPAAGAGILPGDIVIMLDGQEVESTAALVAGIATKAPGAQVRLRLLRSGREHTVSVTVGAPPEELAQQARQKKDQPILMLDTGGHMALVKGLAFTPDGKQLVSAGDDKVIRVWDWQARKIVRTIRGQVGPGPEGAIFGMALSPDRRWLAVGGFMAEGFGVRDDDVGDIRLYDFSSGKLAALLKGHMNIVSGIAFSPDGKLLISGSADGSAIIWDVEKRALRHKLRGDAAGSYVVVFTPDGARAVSGSEGTTLKLWSVKDGREIATLSGHKDMVRSLAVSPTDGFIASGDAGGKIKLWDGRTGVHLRNFADQGGHVGGLRFSLDGRRLLSTCGYSGCNYDQRVWEVPSGKLARTYTEHTNVVLGTAGSPDGRLMATSGGNNHEIRVWDFATGETKQTLAGTGSQRWSAGFSKDGRRLAWGSRPTQVNQGGLLELEIRLPSQGEALGQPERIDPATAAGMFVEAHPKHGAYALAQRSGGAYGYGDAILDINKDGRTGASIERGSKDGYQHRAYTFSPDGQTIVSGGANGFITAYDLNGKKLGDFVGHDSDVWAVTASPDGRLLVSGSGDQTIRLWNLKTRELIVTLFHGSDGEWVMWTPQGYYTGSPGADKIVGWQINKGPESAAEYVGAEQLRQHLNRPDIVEKAIALASAEQAVRQSPGTSFKLADLLSRPVPRFRIVAPLSGSVRQGGGAAVKIVIEATPDPVRLIRVQVNGRQVAEQTPAIDSGGFGAGERILAVPLAKGRNEVRITLANTIGEKTETLTLSHNGDGDLDKRGTLHILAIGVNDYKGLGKSCGEKGKESCNLDFAGGDARRLADAVEKRLGPGHERVDKRVLVNGGNPKDAPTAANITDAVERLRLAKETDTVVLFISGHGKNDGPDYRFLATDASWSDGALRGSTVVPWQTLQGAIEAAKGRRILFIDTCHSGNAYNQRLGNAAYHANIVAYTAARFDQEAMEDPSLGHGLFTYAVVEGLEGKAVMAPRNEISTSSLADYIVGRVGTLAKALNGAQEPQYFRGRDAQDFVLARR
jgi:WD40 repeat protein